MHNNIIRFDEFLLERVELTNQTIGDIYKKLNKNPKLTLDAFRRIFMTDPNTKVDDLMKAEDAVVLQSGVYSNWFVYNTQYFTSEQDGVPYRIFHATVATDPTSVMKGVEIGRIGNYTKWMLHQYATTLKNISGGQRRYEEDLYKIKDAITKLISNKTKLEMNVELPSIAEDNNGEPIKRIIKNPKDINSFKTIRDLLDFTDTLGEQRSKTQMIKDLKAEGSEVVYDGDDVFIVIPTTAEAAKFYGSNTRWCTTSEGNFRQYSEQGALWVVITRDDNEKYQLHFQTKQFMDSEDDGIDLDDFVEEYPSVKTHILQYALQHFKNNKGLFDAIVRFDTDKTIIKRLLNSGELEAKHLDIYQACEFAKIAPKGWLTDLHNDEYLVKDEKVYLIFRDYVDENLLEFVRDDQRKAAEKILSYDMHDWEYNVSFDLGDAIDMMDAKTLEHVKQLIIEAEIMMEDSDTEEEVLITAENIEEFELSELLEHDDMYDILKIIEDSYSSAYDYAYQDKIHTKLIESIESTVDGKFETIHGDDLVIHKHHYWVDGERKVSDLTSNLALVVDPVFITFAVKNNIDNYDSDYTNLGLVSLVSTYLKDENDLATISDHTYVTDDEAAEHFGEELLQHLPDVKTVAEVSENLKYMVRFKNFKK
jgi:hypothetical protein